MSFIKKYGIPEARRVAEQAGTTYGYFYQIACGDRNASFNLATDLVEASGDRLDLVSLMASTDDRRSKSA